MSIDELQILNYRLLVLRFLHTQLGKQKEYFLTGFPADPIFDAWCIDGEMDLSGDVGLLEVPGEYEGSQKTNIVAGYTDEADWNQARDGQLRPPIAMGPWSTFLNKCILPGWQKFMPLYRYGTIVADSIDFENDTCDICLDPEFSSQLNLIVNQGQNFAECKSLSIAGFNTFCANNPTHPTCTNTQAGSPLYISDAQFAELKTVNKTVNDEHEYSNDKSGYRTGDVWAIMGPGDKGDCEDFALTKMQELLDQGYEAKNLQLAAVATETVTDHAVLIIQTQNRGTLVLDNRYQTVLEAAKTPYRFVAYQRAGTDWRYFATKLETVAIEYVNCNSAAFADGDEVVIKFTNQDFSQPKVVGFRQDPKTCFQNYNVFQGDTRVSHNEDWTEFYPDSTNDRYYPVSDSWASLKALPVSYPDDGYWQREYPAYTSSGLEYWIFGGLKRDHAVIGIHRFLFPYPYLVGHDNDSHNNRYTKSTDSWNNRAGMPFSARNDAAGFYLNSKCHYVGGTEWEENGLVTCPVFDDHEQFNDLTNVYLSRASHKRCRSANFTISGKGYMHGGNIVSMGNNGDYYIEDNWTGTTVEYDPETNSFSGKKTTIKQIDGTGFDMDGKGYHAKGRKEGESYAGTLDEFDPVANTWTAKKTYTADYDVNSRPAVGVGRYAYCWQAGTEIVDGKRLDHWSWNKATDSWALVNSGKLALNYGFRGARAVL